MTGGAEETGLRNGTDPVLTAPGSSALPLLMKILLLFLDGVGVGAADPDTNPFMAAALPTLHELTGVSPLTRDLAEFNNFLRSKNLAPIEVKTAVPVT